MKAFTKLASLLLVALSLASLLAGCSSSNPSKAIQGYWVEVDNEDSFLEFTSNSFTNESVSNLPYSVDNENTLVIFLGMLSETYEWDEEQAQEGGRGNNYFWYVSGNTLYWDGDEYQRAKK